jgi:hypothetical protein
MRDVLLVPAMPASTADLNAHPPAGDPPARLSKYTQLERLPADLCGLIRASCLPRGHFFFAEPQQGFRYTYTFEVPEYEWEQHRYGWDPAGELVALMAWSRLIVDNAHTTEFAARVVEYSDGQLQIVPFGGGEAAIAFRPYPDRRDWMDASEAAALSSLHGAMFGSQPLPDRVARAMWMQESSVRLRYVDLALPVLVTSLEALVNTSEVAPTKQFTTRVVSIAAHLGVEGVSKTRCSRVYSARSQSVHGAPIDLLRSLGHDRAIGDMAAMQAVVRSAIRASVHDADFRASFESAEAVRAQWPVEVDGEFV